MASSNTDLYFEHLKGQAQFAYFQLGLAASAIGFAIHQTKERSLLDTPWPLGVAVALWALSFASGCFGIGARQHGIATNIRYLEAVRGIPENIADPQIAEARSRAKQVTQTELDRAGTKFRRQLWMLFAGALFYVAGHVMQMAAIPPKAEASQQRLASEG